MDQDYKRLDIYKFFKESKLHSSKANTYFDIYTELFQKFRGKKITFVEVGVKWGGSLFMWKNFFGDNARIIGIDLYPQTKKLEKYGCEIFIGDQSSEKFWQDFFAKVGKIDILLDDGAHTNEAQIITLNKVLKNINDDGLIVIEDTGASYHKKHFNPSKYSFINYTKFLIDDLNGRVPAKDKSILSGVNKQNSLNESIYSIKIFNSVVAFFVNRKKCIIKENILNRKLEIEPSEIIDDKYINPKWMSDTFTTGFVITTIKLLSKVFSPLKKIKFLKRIVQIVKKKYIVFKTNQKLKKFFN